MELPKPAEFCQTDVNSCGRRPPHPTLAALSAYTWPGWGLAGLTLEILLGLLFAADMVVSCFVAYYEGAERALITHLPRIRARYLSGMVWVDALGVVPFDVGARLLLGPGTVWPSVLRWLRMVRATCYVVCMHAIVPDPVALGCSTACGMCCGDVHLYQVSYVGKDPSWPTHART